MFDSFFVPQTYQFSNDFANCLFLTKYSSEICPNFDGVVGAGYKVNNTNVGVYGMSKKLDSFYVISYLTV